MDTVTDTAGSRQADTELPRRGARIHRLLLWWVALPFLFFWLPLVRSVMDDASYEWGVGWWGLRLGGAGLEGDLWYLVTGTVLGGILLWSGARSGRAFRWITPVWMLMLLARATHAAVSDPNGFVFHGDTLGVEVNLTWIAPTFHALGLLLFTLWLWIWSRASRGGKAAPVRTRGLLALVALLPVQFVLLRFGEPHGLTDAAGVLITIGQWLALPFVLRISRSSGSDGTTLNTD